MATILVVDELTAHRQFLAALMSQCNHRVLEAGDGPEALTLAKAEHPDLIIADMVMRSMGGQEFVHRLQAIPNLTGIPVIFYTGTHRMREAQAAGASRGAFNDLSQLSDPQVVLSTVNATLAVSPLPPHLPKALSRGQVPLLSQELFHGLSAGDANGQRLTALIEISLALISERDPVRLLEGFCRKAREIIGAEYAVVGVLTEDRQTLCHFFIRGTDPQTATPIHPSAPRQGILGELLEQRLPLRLLDASSEPLVALLPPSLSGTRSFLGVPLVTPGRVYGWLCLIDKIGHEEFSREDERLMVTTAAQVAIAYENLKLHEEIQRTSCDLGRKVGKRRRVHESHNRSSLESNTPMVRL